MIKILTRLGIFIWTLWCIPVFILLLLIFFPFFVLGALINRPWSIDLIHHFPWIISRITLFLFAIPVKEKHLNLLDPKGQFIYISNHHSNLDPIIASARIPYHAKYLTKAEVLKIPIFGFVTRVLYVAVQRNDFDDRQRSISDLSKALDNGASLILYPEGTRKEAGPEGKLGDFHRGAFLLSIQHNVPIMALNVINSQERMKGHEYLVTPGKLYTEWSGPYYPEGRSVDEMPEYREQIRADMQERITSKRKALGLTKS